MVSVALLFAVIFLVNTVDSVYSQIVINALPTKLVIAQIKKPGGFYSELVNLNSRKLSLPTELNIAAGSSYSENGDNYLEKLIDYEQDKKYLKVDTENSLGKWSRFYNALLETCQTTSGLISVTAGMIFISLLILVACLMDPCGCEDFLVTRMIDRNSLMEVVSEDHGERIGLLDSTHRSDLYKTGEPTYVQIPRERDEYNIIV